MLALKRKRLLAAAVSPCFEGWGSRLAESAAFGQNAFPTVVTTPWLLSLFPLELRELFFSFFSLVNPF